MFKYVVVAFFLPAVLSPIAQAKKLATFQDPETKLCGFEDEQENDIVEPQYEGGCFESFLENLSDDEELIPVLREGKWFRINEKNQVKFETVFFDNGPDYYEDGLARFLVNGKVGFHDKKGNVVIDPVYDFATPFKKGYSTVCDKCWAYYPESPRYQPLSSSASHPLIQEQYLGVKGGTWGVINIKGEIVVPIRLKSWEKADAALKTILEKNK